ncbi:glutathione ABC transporter permease GsiD [Desulfosarcina ovata subsp. sediminis]|uniref:Glutathione ABC transporter permease GsiD n=1 Tax=Desulfosarcina ovata subsp. sediminis TaxID=885957 RepID=A0A5K7ZIJ2_9BACT|nr:ABC transporter permease [Desulfosarcina ovata]BBO81942.1 glutathione ABC transporter permease GsiD [Desulfosarcina ovata subsp. sediminis]
MTEYIAPFGRLAANRLALAGGILILAVGMMAVLAPHVAPHDPRQIDLSHSLSAPDSSFPLGTNKLGRCVLSQMIYGARVTLGVGVGVVLASALVGMIMGVVSGYCGGMIDELIMRLVDIMLALPGILPALIIAGLLGPGVFNLMLALTVTAWAGYARIVRSSVLTLKPLPFVESARALGASHRYILRVHIVPNCLAPVIVLATFGVARAILAVSALSFLGLGCQAPNFDWGAMLKESLLYMRSAPHLVVFPGLAIMLLVLAFNFLGDGLRDIMDVQSNRKHGY